MATIHELLRLTRKPCKHQRAVEQRGERARGQDLADATHIKILEGGFERQADLLRVVGRMKVTVLATSEAKEKQS